MKYILKISILLLFSLLSCKEKSTIPSVTTNDITLITANSAVSGGIVTNDGGEQVITKGLCWDTEDNPTIETNKSSVSDVSLSFESELTQLSPKTQYYVRAYATNSVGTGYGETITFTTLGELPTSVNASVSAVTTESAILNSVINPNHLSTTVTFEWGSTSSYGNSAVAEQSPVNGNSPVNVSATIKNLLPGTTYHFRIKAENSLGTTYSDNITFSTQEFEWIKTADFPGVARCRPLSFTYNGIGYYGLGVNSITGDNLHDFWTFDPVSSVWTRLNDCPFTFIPGLPVKCLVGSKLYISKEWSLYSYNINTDAWQFVCNTGVSMFASGFSVNDKAFFFIKSNSELYELNVSSNTLIRKNATINNYLNWGLNDIFVINNEAYLLHKNDAKIEVYHYLSQSDTWEKKLEKQFSNLAFELSSFIIITGNSAFIGQSTSFHLSANDENATVTPNMPSSNVWKYDPVKNEFSQCTSLPGEFRAQAGSFSFQNSGYVIGGVTVDPNTSKFRYLKDIWILKR